jgi:hypothetical protein
MFDDTILHMVMSKMQGSGTPSSIVEVKVGPNFCWSYDGF